MGKVIRDLQDRNSDDPARPVMTFEEFYEKNQLNVFRYICKRIGMTEDAKDLTSEIFLACYKNYEKYDPTRSSLNSWLYVIVNNRLKNFYRDKKMHEPIDAHIDSLALSYDDDMGKAAYLDELRDILADALELLPERSRQIIVMKYFDERSSEDIADILGLTPVNVRVITSRAIKQLNSIISSDDVVLE